VEGWRLVAACVPSQPDVHLDQFDYAVQGRCSVLREMTMRKRTLASAGIAFAVVVAGGGLVARSAQAGPATWTPTSAQKDLGLMAAHRVADNGNPDKGAAVAGEPSASKSATVWPANVDSVEMVASTRSQASPFLDGSTGWDDTEVVIVRMAGRFETHVGGAGPDTVSSFVASTVTLVIDANTGKVLDAGSTFPGTSSPGIPGIASLYRR
jgi:hypothetical protein